MIEHICSVNICLLSLLHFIIYSLILTTHTSGCAQLGSLALVHLLKARQTAQFVGYTCHCCFATPHPHLIELVGLQTALDLLLLARLPTNTCGSIYVESFHNSPPPKRCSRFICSQRNVSETSKWVRPKGRAKRQCDSFIVGDRREIEHIVNVFSQTFARPKLAIFREMGVMETKIRPHAEGNSCHVVT